MLEIDHVIIGVADPVAAVSALRNDFGLGAIPGGIHPGGTGNWLVPLQPPQNLELLYVADPETLAGTPSSTLLSMDLTTNPLLGWAVRTDALDDVAARLNIDPAPGSVQNPDGTVARWRVVADYSPEVSSRPFFIEYEDAEGRRPSEWRERYTLARHDVSVHGFSWIQLGGDEGSLRAWLGEARMPLRFAAGDPGVQAVGLTSGEDDIVLRPGTRP